MESLKDQILLYDQLERVMLHTDFGNSSLAVLNDEIFHVMQKTRETEYMLTQRRNQAIARVTVLREQRSQELIRELAYLIRG